jgi:hypothetical protein
MGIVSPGVVNHADGVPRQHPQLVRIITRLEFRLGAIAKLKRISHTSGVKRMKTSWNGKAVVLCALCLFFAQLALAQAQAPAVAPRITEAVDDTKLVTLKGNTHPMARAQFDQGAAPDTLPLKRLMLVLKRSPQQEAALRTLLDEQQDKASPNFHKWLTPDQFGKQFGPAEADVQVVKGWLESHGFEVTNVTKGKTVIEFNANAGLIKQAFHTDLHKFVVNGEAHWANTSDPQIPAAMGPVVDGLTSLHSFFKKPMHVIVKSKTQVEMHPGPRPSASFSGGFFGMAPSDWATIYNVAPVYTANITGSGKTIAIIGRSNIHISDVSDFRTLFNVAPTSNVPEVVLDGPDPGDLGGGEEVEALLDNEWSGGVGSGAAVKFVVSETTETIDGVDLSELYIVDNDLADVMTESFSLCEADAGTSYADFEEQVAEQAAAQGITFVAATGDSGANNCDNPGTETTASGPISVGLPASTPFTTAVGGTEFNDHNDDSIYWSTSTGAALKYIPEFVWNESCIASNCPPGVNSGGGEGPNIAAGGGGASSIFTPKPAFQSGVAGIPNDGARDIPDISFVAGGAICEANTGATCTSVNLPFGYLVCQGGSCSGSSPTVLLVAGTSGSTPSFAGVMSLVDQKTGSRQGLANIVLYHLASGETFSQCNGSTLEPGTPPASTCVFNDVTVGNNSLPKQGGGETSGFSAGTGFDLASGLGSANVANLVNNWGSFVRTTTTTTLSLTPTSIMHGQNVTASGTVTGSGGTPTGDVAFVADGTTLAGTGFEPLSGGNFNGTAIPDLPGGGPYNVVAKYSGDTKFAPSSSTAVSVTVTPEPSATSISVLSGTTGNPITSAAAGSLVFISVNVAGNSGQGVPTGTVTISDADASDGATLTLNSIGNAELQTTTLSSGSHSFSASYGGDPSFNSSSTTASATLTITGTSGGGSFSLSASPNAAATTPGSPASTTITATGSGGFAGSVALTASVSGPAGATAPPSCSFGTSPIALSASTTSGTSSMSCSTIAASQVIYVPQRGPNRPIWLALGASLALACIFLLSLPAPKRRWASAFALLVLASAAVAVGCGGGGNGGGGGGGGGTSSGVYTVTVTGTSGSSTQTTTFTITVN